MTSGRSGSTHEAAIRIIDKKGPLANPADRDHCIQYMVAVPLIFGSLTAADYEDEVAQDPRIDALRAKIVCVEDKRFTRDYHDPKKRSIANALTVEFKDGTTLEEVVCEYPIGHKRRRAEGMPVLVEKLARREAARQGLELLHQHRHALRTPPLVADRILAHHFLERAAVLEFHRERVGDRALLGIVVVGARTSCPRRRTSCSGAGRCACPSPRRLRNPLRLAARKSAALRSYTGCSGRGRRDC